MSAGSIFAEDGSREQVEVSPSDIGLFHAAEAGDLPTVNRLLANEARVTYCNAAGNNAIHVAILMGHSEVALYLLDQAHRDINQRNNDGQTYVMCAASREDVKTLEQLIKMGADLEAADREGRRAIMFAISAGDKSWVAFRKLLNAGVNLNATDKRGFSSIDYAAGLSNRGSANGIIILRWLMDEDVILQAART